MRGSGREPDAQGWWRCQAQPHARGDRVPGGRRADCGAASGAGRVERRRTSGRRPDRVLHAGGRSPGPLSGGVPRDRRTDRRGQVAIRWVAQSSLASMSAPLLVVDAPFLLYRSFFALPESITGAEGKPIGALLGGANLLLRAAVEREPRAIVLCFGAEAAATACTCTRVTTRPARPSRRRCSGSSTKPRSSSPALVGTAGTPRTWRPTTCSGHTRWPRRPRAAAR